MKALVNLLKTAVPKPGETTTIARVIAIRYILRNDVPETTKFYETLSIVGTDFTLMTQLLPQYSRKELLKKYKVCLLYTSPSPRDGLLSRMPSSA